MGRRALTIAALAAVTGALAGPAIQRRHARQQLEQRLDTLAGHASDAEAPSCWLGPRAIGIERAATGWGGLALASWQTIGGCGAGAVGGTGGAVKWIGRGVTGGEVQIQCQTSLVGQGPGRRELSSTVQVTRELTDRWVLGVLVPYVYKSRDQFPRPDLKLANRGLGDVNVMATRRFGALAATEVSLWAGLPTGSHETHWQFGAQRAPLPNELQLGLGRPTASLIVDHIIDRDWGPSVLGATANYRGGRDDLGNVRAANASAYAYAGYLAGAFVPALGASLTGALAHDQSLGQPQDNARLTLALNASVEWAGEWVAVLASVSLPYARRAGGLSLEPWVVSAGLSFSPF